MGDVIKIKSLIKKLRFSSKERKEEKLNCSIIAAMLFSLSDYKVSEVDARKSISVNEKALCLY